MRGRRWESCAWGVVTDKGLGGAGGVIRALGAGSTGIFRGSSAFFTVFTFVFGAGTAFDTVVFFTGALITLVFGGAGGFLVVFTAVFEGASGFLTVFTAVFEGAVDFFTVFPVVFTGNGVFFTVFIVVFFITAFLTG